MATDAANLPTRIGGYLRRHAPRYVTGALLLAAFQLVMNQIEWRTKLLVDCVFAPMGVCDAATASGLVLLALGLASFGLRLGSRWVFLRTGTLVQYELRARVMHALHRLGQEFYRRTPPGELLGRVTADTPPVQRLFGAGVLLSLNFALGLASVLVVMLRISGRLTIAALVTTPVIALFARALSGRMLTLSRQSQRDLGRLAELAQRYLSSMRGLRSLGVEDAGEAPCLRAVDEHERSRLTAARAAAAGGPIASALGALGMLIVFWYGATLLDRPAADGGISLGGLFAFLLASARLSASLAAITDGVSIVARGRASFERLREILDAPMNTVATRPDEAPANGALSVRELRYASDGQVILEGVSFELSPGRSLALVGRTGAGKSTLAMLLARRLSPPPGTIHLDGRDVLELDGPALRRRMLYAQQERFLFSGSVADNVALGAVDGVLPERALTSLLTDVRILAEIEQLPAGVDTLVGERGTQLSGGQVQRLALARALAAAPALLVLDDPLSSVDAGTEASIFDAIKERRLGQSLLLVTHRISAAARCDEVLVLEGGRVTQRGTPAELGACAGLYAELAAAQHADASPTVTTSTEVPAGPSKQADAPASLAAVPVSVLARLWPFFRDDRPSIAIAALLVLASTVTGLLVPLSVGAVAAAATARRSLTAPALTTFAVMLATSVIAFIGGYVYRRVGAHGMSRVQRALFSRMSALAMRFYDRTSVGQLVTRLVGDPQVIGDFFSMNVFALAGDSIGVIAIAALMLTLDWRLALVGLAPLPLAALLVAGLRRRIRGVYRIEREALAQLGTLTNEHITGAAVIQAYGQEALLAARFDATNRSHHDAALRTIVPEAALGAITEAVTTIAVTAILLWTAHARAAGFLVSFATLLVFQQLLSRLYPPLSQLTVDFTVWQSVAAASVRVFELLDSPAIEPPSGEGHEGLARDDEVLALDHVGFAYRAGHPTLTDVSLRARRGERIALVGPTGAGKSTVAQLLLRLYDTDAGMIRVLGRDVRDWDRSALRRQFAVVPQDVLLFAGTLLENIAFGEASPDRERATAALRALGIEELIQGRAGGMDAVVDERGLNFSVGERQLISFARAIYRDAPILLLDEATANIDTATEARLQHALERLLHGRTALIVAHRLSTIQSASCIFVFRDGAIREEGRHADLLARGGIYARMAAGRYTGHG